jgi:uncharacterized protein with PIN domain
MASRRHQAEEAAPWSRVFPPRQSWDKADCIAVLLSRRRHQRSGKSLAAHAGKLWIPAADCVAGKSISTTAKTSRWDPGVSWGGHAGRLSSTPTRKRGSANDVTPFRVRLSFHGDLPFFLKRRAGPTTERYLAERTSVKDIIESCGVPHTEVDLILVNGQPTDFAAFVTQDVAMDVHPVELSRPTVFLENRLQVLHIEKFVADGHLGKLVRDLRLLGIDVAYDRAAEDRQLLRIAENDGRAILTRDRHLLMHASVGHGYYLRSQEPLEQTIEVLRRFELFPCLKPFTRCLRCNSALKPVEKAKIIDELEPLTKIYYEQFRRCTSCGQIYWSGSHFKKLEARIAKLRQRL